MTRKRLDLELVRRGLAPTTEDAAEAIHQGRVTISGRPAIKPETLVASSEPVAVETPSRKYVSRGGDKLVAALDRFEIDVAARRALDAGASTGGFTDALLSRGAAQVIAVDVGYGQLAWRLRNDDRVIVMERTNVRDLVSAKLPYRPDLVTADLSFISLASVTPDLVQLAGEGADLLLLVKPQFEAPRGRVPAGGVVVDPSVWREAVQAVADACTAAGSPPLAAMASPVPGTSGNVEFFVHARAGAEAGPLALDAAMEEGEALLRVKGEAS